MSQPLKIGLFSMNMDACGDPETAVAVARSAEEAGFESLWAGEHPVLPDPRSPDSPMVPAEPILDPVVTLAVLAAHTSRVKLGTGVLLLPLRHPLLLAKELASLDVLSRGRLLVGVGAGYLEPELRAFGVPMAERGARLDDHLAAMVAAWNAERTAYDGRFVAFSGVQARPLPYQHPHPPIIVGGHSPAAYRRAVEAGNGWYGFNQTPEAAARSLAGLQAAADCYSRPSALGDLEVTVTPRGEPDPVTAAAFAAIGVHRLVYMPPRHLGRDDLLRYVDRVGRQVIA